MTSAIRIVLASALITAAAIKAAPALAEPTASDVVRTVRIVPTSDLDLSSRAGQRQLDIRVAHAVRAVCGTAAMLDLEGANEVRECRKDALAAAKAQRDAILGAAARREALAVTAAR